MKMLNIFHQFNIKMRLVWVGLFIICLCNIGQVVAGNGFGDYCDRDSSLETSTNYNDKVLIKKCYEENCLSNISLPRGYDNRYKLEEYNDGKLLIQKIKSENTFYSSHSYSFKNKEYNTTEFDISKFKLEMKDATKSKNENFCEDGANNLNEILFPVAKTDIALNTSNMYLYKDNEYNPNKV